MKDIIKSLIETIEPQFTSDASSSSRPLPNQVTFYLDNNLLHFINITLTLDGLSVYLDVDVWEGEEEYVLSDDELGWVYQYGSDLIYEERDATTKAYDGSDDHQSDHSYYIR